MAKAVINLDAIRANARQILQRVTPARLMAVVKANAYGHGAVRVAQTLRDFGIDFFGVATIDEAVELRDGGIVEPVLVMTPLMPGTLDAYIERRIDATIGSQAGLSAALRVSSLGRLRVHLKIDTGMGRVGLLPNQSSDALAALRQARGVELVGVATHLSSADEDDLSETLAQVRRLGSALEDDDTSDLIVHVANTEAVARAEPAYRSHERMMVRTGIGLYGCPIRSDTREFLDLRPAMTLESEVTNLKRVEAGTPISYNGRWIAERSTTIATVGIGYADGYRRSMFGRAEVGIAGRRHPVVGTICMDSFMVDLGPKADDVGVGDRVVLFGPGGPDLGEVSQWAETIPYEILCGIGRRVERVYIESARSREDRVKSQ